MVHRLILPLALSCALLASTAHARTSAPAPYQGWVNQSRVATPDVTVDVELTTPEACPGALACTDGSTIWFDGRDRGEFFHELGHVTDYTLTDADRARLSTIMRRRASWYSEADGGLASGSEWFADAYSLCARLRRIDPRWTYSTGSGLLRGSRLAKVCRLVDRRLAG